MLASKWASERVTYNEHRHKFQCVLTKDCTHFFHTIKKTCTPSFWTKYKRAPNAKYALCLLEYRYRVIMCEKCVYFHIIFFCFCRSLFAPLERFFFILYASSLYKAQVARVTAFVGEIKWFPSEYGLFGVYIVGRFSSLLEYTFFCILFVFYLVFSDKKIPVWCKLCVSNTFSITFPCVAFFAFLISNFYKKRLDSVSKSCRIGESEDAQWKRESN